MKILVKKSQYENKRWRKISSRVLSEIVFCCPDSNALRRDLSVEGIPKNPIIILEDSNCYEGGAQYEILFCPWCGAKTMSEYWDETDG